MIRWYKTGGKRFYMIDVSGYRVTPRSGQAHGGSHLPGTSYSILDRDNMHLGVGSFFPGGGRSSEGCRKQALAFAKDLNRRFD